MITIKYSHCFYCSRFYVACSRLTGNLGEVIAYMYGIFYDPVPISLSIYFITFYTTWPAVISRLDLIRVNSDESLDLTRVKLSPLSATFQLIAFVEAYRKKEASSLKVKCLFKTVLQFYFSESTSF